MPILNGDASGSTVPLLAAGRPVIDHSKALEVLEQEYQSRDGLSIHDLIDSKKNGALTYNDFLVLPGYIGMFLAFIENILMLTIQQASPPQPSLLILP